MQCSYKLTDRGDYSGVDYEITVDDIFKAVFEADTKGKNFLMEEVQCRK